MIVVTSDSGITNFGIGFRSTGGSAVTLSIPGVSQAAGVTIGAFHYIGLAG